MLFITLCWFRLPIALFAEDALWYFTIAVVILLPKLSCSIKHFYKAPSVENNLYKSSFVKSGCNPITFNVLPFSWAASLSLSFETFLGTLWIFPLPYWFLEILEILERGFPVIFYLNAYLLSRLNFLGALSSLSCLNRLPCLPLSSFRIPRRLSVGPRLKFLLPLSSPLDC